MQAASRALCSGCRGRCCDQCRCPYPGDARCCSADIGGFPSATNIWVFDPWRPGALHGHHGRAAPVCAADLRGRPTRDRPDRRCRRHGGLAQQIGLLGRSRAADECLRRRADLRPDNPARRSSPATQVWTATSACWKPLTDRTKISGFSRTGCTCRCQICPAVISPSTPPTTRV